MKRKNVGSVDLAAMREEYVSTGLNIASVPRAPLPLWNDWLADAVAAKLPEPNAMVVSTVTRPTMVGQPAQPSSRIVLCKSATVKGFDFYTNYRSRKSEEIKSSGTVAATFPWIALQRQVNIVGSVEQVSSHDSDTYWASRQRGSKLGAWASSQSSKIDTYEELEERCRHFGNMYPGDVPRPPHWGGWRIVPTTIEFWQGRPNRLHDRIMYERKNSGQWSIGRLSP